MIPHQKVLGMGVVSVCINFLLMGIKISVGLLGNSYALVADGIESASDIVSSLVTWTGFQLSLKPADQNHPYGHGKIEALAGLFSGFSLLTAAGIITYHSIREILTPHHAPAWFTLPVLIGVVIVKEMLSRKILALNQEIESTALKGDAWHHRSDAITSAAAAIGIAVALIGGDGYEMADDWGALVACVVITCNAYVIGRDALNDILDSEGPEEIRQELKSMALRIPGVQDIEKCRIRKSGISLFVELHVLVDGNMPVREGHRIGHLVKNDLMQHQPRIIDVLVHLEPLEVPPAG